LIIAASMVVLFGVAFAIGRATSSASTAHPEAQGGVTVVPAGAALPIRLSSAPALPVAAVAPPPVRAQQRSRPAAPAQASSVSPELAATEVPAATPAPTQPAAVAAPSAPASVPSAPAPSSSGSGPSKPSSGGGSFESSG